MTRKTVGRSITSAARSSEQSHDIYHGTFRPKAQGLGVPLALREISSLFSRGVLQ